VNSSSKRKQPWFSKKKKPFTQFTKRRRIEDKRFSLEDILRAPLMTFEGNYRESEGLLEPNPTRLNK
jgi:hypothetical protein